MRQIFRFCILSLELAAVTACAPSLPSSNDNLETCTPASGSLQQEELSTFDGCERLDGHLVLRNGFPDRSNLSSIVVITGNLNGGGYGGEPLSLDGLDSLEVVEGGFGFFEEELNSYLGVPKLRIVGSFRTDTVQELEDFQGLENLAEVRGNFTVTYNPNLRSFAGLEGLERVRGDLRVAENPLLPPEEIDTFLERITVEGEVKVW